MKKTKFVLAALALAVLTALSACGENDTPPADEKSGLEELTANTVDAVITLESGDKINLELYPDLAPKTVENFIKLANDGTFEGTIFHRVIKDFMIQGGGFDENLEQRDAEPIEGEFADNGFTNELSHTRGVISMARTNDPNSASSQFFIVHADSTYLDGAYAAFGKVKDDESMAVVDSIAEAETYSYEPGIFDDFPVEPVVIKSVEILDEDE